jgi:hypothetical protein
MASASVSPDAQSLRRLQGSGHSVALVAAAGSYFFSILLVARLPGRVAQQNAELSPHASQV